MRTLLTALLAIHGVIHVVGFLERSGLTALLWLTALLVLLASARLRIASSAVWWIPALAGVVLSQAMIFSAWQDASYGSLVNLLLLLPIVAAAAEARFTRTVDAEVRALLASAPAAAGEIVRREELAPLPAPVRRWLESSGIVGRERARTVRLRQRGELRTAPDAGWMPASAVQYFTVDEPAFIWRVEATMLGVLPFAGRDRYAQGRGQMLIKAAGLLDVVNSGDEKIAQGAMLRFLGEIVWFPSAALSPYLSWEALDETHARATMRHAGLTASAVFSFDERGRVLGLSAERWLGGGTEAKLTPWFVSCTEWRTLHGVEVPVRGEVSWSLASGPFSYYRWEILEVEADRPELFAHAERAGIRHPLGAVRTVGPPPARRPT